ncbi:MAG: haloacid dehalogenase-like hydrolase [Terracidiphilus sp.]
MHWTATSEEDLKAMEPETLRWSAEQFEQLVLDSQLRVAVFDCDGTLWSGDSGASFLFWSIEQGLVSRSTADWIDTRYRAYQTGQVSELDICGEMVQIYAGLREAELVAAAQRFMQGFVRPRIFAEMEALVAGLRQRGVELWAVSSTNKWVVAAGAALFGIAAERVLAAEVEVTAGLIGSRIVDVPTDEGKATTLRRVGLERPDAVFGNSIHDLAMLEMARNPFPVNPSPALLGAAAKRGWSYFRPRSAEEAKAAPGGE